MFVFLSYLMILQTSQMLPLKRIAAMPQKILERNPVLPPELLSIIALTLPSALQWTWRLWRAALTSRGVSPRPPRPELSQRCNLSPSTRSSC